MATMISRTKELINPTSEELKATFDRLAGFPLFGDWSKSASEAIRLWPSGHLSSNVGLSVSWRWEKGDVYVNCKSDH